MAEYRERWRVDVRCDKPKGDDDEIVVCALRDADKYRVPLVAHGQGGNSDDRLDQMFDANDGHPPCGEGAFMVRCGSVGVAVRVGRGRAHYVRREPAP